MKEERWRVKMSNEMWFNERLVEEYGEPGHEYIQKQERKGEEKGGGSKHRIEVQLEQITFNLPT